MTYGNDNVSSDKVRKGINLISKSGYWFSLSLTISEIRHCVVVYGEAVSGYVRF